MKGFNRRKARIVVHQCEMCRSTSQPLYFTGRQMVLCNEVVSNVTIDLNILFGQNKYVCTYCLDSLKVAVSRHAEAIKIKLINMA